MVPSKIFLSWYTVSLLKTTSWSILESPLIMWNNEIQKAYGFHVMTVGKTPKHNWEKIKCFFLWIIEINLPTPSSKLL